MSGFDLGQKYWFNGLPIQAAATAGDPPGSLRFWINGLPAPFALPAGNAAVYLYKGVRPRGQVYLGIQTDAEIYLGESALFPP